MFSALQVAGPCCFCPYPPMRLQAVVSTGDRSCLLWFCCCCCFCLPPSHFCLQGRGMGHYNSTRAAPVHCNELSLSSFFSDPRKNGIDNFQKTVRLRAFFLKQKQNNPLQNLLTAVKGKKLVLLE